MLWFVVLLRSRCLFFWTLNFGIVLSVICFESLGAAEFSKAPTNGGPDIIAIAGYIVYGDEKKFVDLALSTQRALVVLHSPGGNLHAGIEIGRAIHLKGFATLVPDGLQCASACALAWLGGAPRLMGDTARVGFHAVYTDHGGQPAISSAGNALVGAYLNQLGLSTSAVFYITSPPPAGMQWLSFSDARQVGIDVQRIKSQSAAEDKPRANDQSPDHRETTNPHVAAIKSNTYRFITTTNKSNDNVTFFLQSIYDDSVNYFGTVQTKSAVVADKQSFFRRWPERNYSIRPDSLAVVCKNDTSCEVRGVIDWAASNHSKISTGSASIELNWKSTSGQWKIDSETSRVLSRQISASVANEKLPLKPRYHLDETNTKPLSLSNLNPDPDCSGTEATGKVVKRQFGKDGLMLTGFVLEGTNGSREFINVDVKLEDFDEATKSWVMRGLHTLLAQGRSADAYIRLCGAAGRVEMLDALK